MEPAVTADLSGFLATARSFLDALPDSVVITVPSGHMIYANPSACRLLGRHVDALVGLHAEVVLGPKWKKLSEVLSSGRPQPKINIRIEEKLCRATAFPLRLNGQINAVLSFFEGAFAYDKLSPELESYKQTARTLDAIMECLYDGLWITDSQGNVLKMNKGVQRIKGCTPEECLGKNVRELVAAGYIDQSVTQLVLERKTTVTIVQKTRTNKKVLATGTPIFDSNGEIDIIVVNDRDITELEKMRRDLEMSKALVDLYRNELSELQSRELQSNHYVCQSKVMQTVYEKALRVARFDTTVLLAGESGVGKGLLAKLIHQRSERCNGPFVRVDCSGIPETLFESEVFGYEKGAFSGAGPKGKLGLVELAEGGTLFLDEIGEVPMAQQVKLLRFLDEKALIRVGGTSVRPVDARLIAATNKDLAEEVRKGRFRRDLFYRLNVVSLLIPPLRERPQDIVGLITFFIKKFGSQYQVNKQVDRETIDALLGYHYPGNIRELENIIESMMVLSGADLITLKDLPAEVRSSGEQSEMLDNNVCMNLKGLIGQISVDHILRAIEKYGSQRQAARRLGVNQSTISRRLRQHLPSREGNARAQS
jgi:PAS domain S-box-containing protein